MRGPTSIFCKSLTALWFLASPGLGAAVTPIAHWDVVPNQRIEVGQVFNLGVVAFSKAGIDKVQFAISGQGYSGRPTLDVSSMVYNPRTELLEYWTPIAAASFQSAGSIDVSATVRGRDGGTRTLAPVTLFVDPTGALPHPTAWVSMSGGDDTGQVNNRSRPFATIGKAAEAIQSWMNGNGYGNKADGGIVRLLPGEHTVSAGNVTTDNEWLTITHDPSAGGTRTNTIINRKLRAFNTRWLKVEGLTLVSTGYARFLFEVPDDDPNRDLKTIWVDDCRIDGFDRHNDLPHPIGKYPNKYFTSCHVYNTRRGTGVGPKTHLVRNLLIEHIGDDAFQNAPLVLNVTVRDVHPGGTGWHADAWQYWGSGPRNVIVYNFHASDLHYQGLFCRAQTPAADAAFVNMFIELRDPIINPGGMSSLYGSWDHLVFWHNTFVNHHFNFHAEDGVLDVKNASFIGNVFDEFRITCCARVGQETQWTLPGNANNNVFLHNHYGRSRTDGDSSAGYHAKSPDTGVPGTQSLGDPLLDLNPSSPTFGHPLSTSPLLGRVLPLVVRGDFAANLREAPADLGPFAASSPGTLDLVPPSPPANVRVVPAQ